MNEFQLKKQSQFGVEVFDTKEMNFGSSIPHQQILIEREVEEFRTLSWEPNGSKLAVLTKSKKVLEAGQKNFSNDPYRNGVDVFSAKIDSTAGLTIKNVGAMASDKT